MKADQLQPIPFYSKLLRRPKLLIVDDEEVNLMVFQELFGQDCDVFTAGDGEQALQLANVVTPDVILLDIILPKLSGYEVCAALKSNQQTQEIPVIFISSLDDCGDEIKGFDLGAVDYIHKPINATITRSRVYAHTLLKQHADHLKDIATIDVGTGIANRRQYEEHLHRAWANAIREQQPISVILMDIDHFKFYNDTYGHLRGDECLRRVAQAMASCVKRPQDLVARYGGEEFVAILPNTDHLGAAFIAQEIVASVRALGLEHSRSSHGVVTLSAGISTLIPHKDMLSESIILSADEALYTAKESGRNQYAIARKVMEVKKNSPSTSNA